MNNTEKKGRGEKALDEIFDTGVEAATNWGKNFVSEAVPKIMDWFVITSREIFTSLKDDKKPTALKAKIQELAEFCFKQGEKSKEHAMIEAMKKSGFDEKQIQQVLSCVVVLDGSD